MPCILLITKVFIMIFTHKREYIKGSLRWKDPLAGGSVKGAPDEGGWGRVRDVGEGMLYLASS